MKTWMKRKRTGSYHDCINNYAQKATLRAIRHTPKARLTGYLGAPTDPKKGGKTKKQRFFYAKASKGGKRKGTGGNKVMLPAALKLWKRARSSTGAIKAGFIQPALDFGAKVRLRPFAGGSASRSKGQKSYSGNKVKAQSFNAVEASGDIAYRPMLKALSEIIKEEDDWATGRLKKANKSFGGGRKKIRR